MVPFPAPEPSPATATRTRLAVVRRPSESSDVADACSVCGAHARTTILTADTIASQLRWLAEFHRRRLKPAALRRRAALEDRAAFTQDEPRAIVGCRGCGLVFRHPRRDPDAVERDYARDQYGEERLRTLFATQADAYDDKLAVLARLVAGRRRPRVLEVGSFVGAFLAAAGAAGWDAFGVDPGEEVVAFCRARGLTVQRGTIDDVALPPASLDAVAVWNTFDQIAAPRPLLAAASRMLRGGGVLALRVPNGRYFVDAVARLAGDRALVRRARLLALAWNNLIGFPYLHGYAVGTLDRLVAPHGFERIVAQPDTLVTLADDDTRAVAALEERLVKLGCRLAWRHQIPGPARLAKAPWLDVYYRRGSAVPR